MEQELLAYLTEELRRGRRVCVATVVESSLPAVVAGRQAALAEGGRPGPHGFSLGLEALDVFVRRRVEAMLEQAAARPQGRVTPPKERMAHIWWPGAPGERPVRLFVELFEPAPRLLLVGAGQDASPLCRIGSEAGFEVLVTDHRPAFARPERLPGAAEVRCVPPDELPDEWLGPNTYAVVMNHHLMRDIQAVTRLVTSPAPYIGVLGPRARTEKLLARVEQALGRPLAEGELARVYSPVGIDIGGESPGAIALGIVAEVMALRYGRAVPHLKDRRGPLHPDRLDPVDAPGAAHGGGEPPAPSEALVCGS